MLKFKNQHNCQITSDNKPSIRYEPATLGLSVPGIPGSQPVINKIIPVIHNFTPPPIPLPGHGLPRALNYHADYGGCGFWRMIWPETVINGYQKGVIMGMTSMIGDANYYKNGLKCVKFQRQATPQQLDFFKCVKKVMNDTGGKVVYEVDDIIFKDDIPDFNRCKEAFLDDRIVASVLEMMNIADEITVTCEYMKQYYIKKTGNSNIRVIPNYPPRYWGDRLYDINKLGKRYNIHKKRPRIGYCGSGTHFDIQNKTNQIDDFAHVVDYIISTRNKFKWVFMGGFPLKVKPFIDRGIMEYVNWSPILEYPVGIDNLDVNCVIAPLVDCEFNRAKSNIKYLEPAMLGIPAICQDMVTYKDCPIKFKTGEEMISQIEYLLKDQGQYINMCKKVRKYADSMWLEDRIDEHCEMYFKSANEPRPALKRLNPEII